MSKTSRAARKKYDDAHFINVSYRLDIALVARFREKCIKEHVSQAEAFLKEDI